MIASLSVRSRTARPRRARHLRGAASGILPWVVAFAALGAPARAFAVFAPATGDTAQLIPARLYLTWHAPYGQPGATEQLMAACGDTTVKDTLYMSFDPGRDAPHFQSFTATLYFWAESGDTLDPHWNFGEGQSFRRLKVEYAPESVPGTDPAWPASALAASGYNTSRASGKLRMIAAGQSGGSWPLLGGKVYVAARLLVPRPAVKARGCDRPMCIEWSSAMFGLGGGQLPEIRSGQRFVSWNSRGGKVCAAMRSFAAPAPWQPKQQLPPGWKGR